MFQQTIVSSVNILAVVDRDNEDHQARMLHAVNNPIVAGSIFSIALPLPSQELPKAWIKGEPVDGFCDSPAEFSAGMDEAVEFPLSKR